MALSVAIVGSGPSGFYTADALMKLDPDCEIDIIDELPTPFGLIRAGVAPDHQTTKKVQKAFDRMAQKPQIRFFGNVKVGREVSIDELKSMYDAVILAVGSPEDKPLGIPGEDKKGVIGAAALVGWYNGHPDFVDLDPDLNTKAVAVIGNGNVAIDIARVFAKTDAEMAETDIPDYAWDAIRKSPVTDIYMFGRRGPVEASFTNVELREMGHLENAAAIIDPAQLPDEVTGDWSDRDRRLRNRNLKTMREFLAIDQRGKSKKVHFAFFTKPVEVLGGDKVEGLRLEHTRLENNRAVGTGEFFEIECGLVMPAIGYRAIPIEGVPYNEDWAMFDSDQGRMGEGLYCVGWAKRGPSGVIGTNKPDGKEGAQQVIDDLGKGGDKAGRNALEAHLDACGAEVVDYSDWRKLEEMENANATPPRPRKKFVRIADMLAALEA